MQINDGKGWLDRVVTPLEKITSQPKEYLKGILIWGFGVLFIEFCALGPLFLFLKFL